MMAICPAGPPKLMKPSFSQYQKACASVTGSGVCVLPEICCCDVSMTPPWRTLQFQSRPWTRIVLKRGGCLIPEDYYYPHLAGKVQELAHRIKKLMMY